jgi:hypothetical protein
MANLAAITGFLIERWPSAGWQPNPGLWVVISFVTSAYAIVTQSNWVWRRWQQGIDSRQPTENNRGGLFILNAMAALPALTVWLYVLLSALNVPVLALAVAWAVTSFVAINLNWTGETIGPLASDQND